MGKGEEIGELVFLVKGSGRPTSANVGAGSHVTVVGLSATAFVEKYLPTLIIIINIIFILVIMCFGSQLLLLLHYTKYNRGQN